MKNYQGEKMLISRKLAKWFSNYDNQKSLGSRLRARRIAPLLEMIESTYKDKGSVSIIDLGGTSNYWNIILGRYLNDYNVRITVVNLPDISVPEDYGSFRFIEADACNLSQFSDNSFDIAHSSSVVGHVGDWGRMVSFAEEVRRVSKRYFVQTPNYWFPIEPPCMTPFFHWLPKPARQWLVSNFQMGHWKKANSTDEAVRIVERDRLPNKKIMMGDRFEYRQLGERHAS